MILTWTWLKTFQSVQVNIIIVSERKWVPSMRTIGGNTELAKGTPRKRRIRKISSISNLIKFEWNPRGKSSWSRKLAQRAIFLILENYRQRRMKNFRRTCVSLLFQKSERVPLNLRFVEITFVTRCHIVVMSPSWFGNVQAKSTGASFSFAAIIIFKWFYN